MITNKEVLERIKPEMSLEAMALKQKLVYFGHVLRTDDFLEKRCLCGEVEGKRRRGRPRRAWVDDIRESTGMSLEVLSALTADRIGWRKLAYTIVKS